MGIDAGPCVVGDLGVRDAARWSAAGPATDLATRLQALTMRYQVPILVSGAVQEKAAPGFLLRTLDPIPAAAAEAAGAVFELVAERNGADAGTVEMVGLFEEGRVLFEKRDWQGALSRFTQVLSMRTVDGPAALYAERCRMLLEDPSRPSAWPAW
jgi:adenylate cyclase